MADKLPPLAALEQKELASNQARRKALEEAMKEVREAEALLNEARLKVQALQREQLASDFDYETSRRRIEEDNVKAA